MDNNLEVLFYEKQAEKFLQKKTDVARGVIELGQILIETKEKLPHGSWIKWLEDSRVGFNRSQASKYMKIAENFKGEMFTSSKHLDNLSLNKLYSLASAPEEIKEEVIHSKDKEEAERKIKEYEEKLKQEREAKNKVIQSNLDLQKQLQKEKNKPEKIKEVVVEVEVDKTDYVAMSKIDKIKKENERLREEKESLEKRLQAKKELAEAYENDSNELKKMRNEITYLTQQKDEIGRRIQSITDISGLVVEIDSLIKNKLAPVRYSKSILEAKDDEIVIENLTEIVQVVQSWVDEMKQYIPNKINFVEVL